MATDQVTQLSDELQRALELRWWLYRKVYLVAKRLELEAQQPQPEVES
jgi:hypothetical protein